eukprot:16379-Heterococcus_DN1.PRE.1
MKSTVISTLLVGALVASDVTAFGFSRKEAIKNDSKDIVHQVKGGIKDASGDVRDAARSTGNRARNAAESAGDSARDAAHSAGNSARHAGRDARDAARSTGNSARRAGRDARNAARSGSSYDGYSYNDLDDGSNDYEEDLEGKVWRAKQAIRERQAGYEDISRSRAACQHAQLIAHEHNAQSLTFAYRFYTYFHAMHTGLSGGDYDYGYDAEHAAHKTGSFFDKLRGKTSSAESDAENYARGGARNVRNAGRD